MKTIMKMKEMMIAVALVVVMNLAFDSCIATRDTTKINKVEMGMSKSDIQHLLGTPLFKNADETGEQWGYRKVVGEIIDAEEMLFVVTFDNDGKVVAYNSVKEFPPHRHP
ncbi:MAG: outer membrane protein assembly factor BamE [Muribaculaceae bacterium]|nr:outer membrane protein assembly factor BamE [Muribaculaceae bacterium]